MNGVNALKVLLLASLLGVQLTVLAVDGEADMTFHGTLIAPPPCTINDGNQVEVDFGDRVGISKVDGVNYRMPVNYQITCQGNGSGWAMRLSLNGSAAAFDADALQSDHTELGIRVYRNDVPFTPNTRVDIDSANPPRLEVVPVKQAGATLTEGTFEAWATLQADYE